MSNNTSITSQLMISNIMFNTMSILHLNIRSITTPDKKVQLNNLIHLHSPDFISINETFLKPKHALEIEGYRVLRHDRLVRKGGGTALCIRNNILGKQIKFDNSILDEYAVGFLAKTAYGDVAIFSLYITPSYNALNTNLFSFISKFGKFVLTGDLNAKSRLWHCPVDNKKGLELEPLLVKHKLHILNNKTPTYKSSNSILDLSICSNPMLSKFHKFQVLKDHISDHQATLSSFKITTNKLIIEIQKIDYDLLKHTLESCCIYPAITDIASLDQAAYMLDQTFSNALTLATKKSKITKPCRHSIEIPKHILDLIREKRKARRLMCKRNTPESRSLFNKLNLQVKSMLSKFRQCNLESKFSDLKNFNQSSSKHWKTINNLQNVNSTKDQPTTLFSESVPYSDQSQIAEKFGSIFSKTFGTPTHLKDLPVYPVSSPSTELTITEADFDTALKKCNKKSAPGNDGISNRIVSNCPDNIKSIILNIFQFSLKLGHIPKSWKAAKIIMIHKKGKPKNEFTSYRPISLLNCLSKLLEKMINFKITKWAESNNIFPPEQSGFRAKRSCQDHILRLTQQIINGFNDTDDKRFTGAVFFDLEKAFDMAPHSGIINKLEKNKLHPCLINWVKSFLTDRSYQVKWENKLSNSFSINRGVPQGSCLSPTLFNIYFSDIIQSIPKCIDKALFADDLGIWCSDSSLKLIECNLQRAINKISDFCDKWGLMLNKKKTFFTVFCPAGLRKNYNKTYNLNLRIKETLIPLDPHPTFLGITLDPKLDFKKHMEIMTKKIANKVNLFRKIKSMKINHLKINSILFKSLIRPVFDYAFIAICSPTQRISSNMQIIQNRILRAIKYFPPRTRISDIHSFFKVKSIKCRSAELLKKFTIAKRDHDLISAELDEFQTETLPRDRKYETVFDKMLKFNAG